MKQLKKAILNIDESLIDEEGGKGLANFAPDEEDVIFEEGKKFK